jgi:hypothetical protein
MDQILGKVGGYWFNQRAGKEMSGVGDDINVSIKFFFLVLIVSLDSYPSSFP